MKYDFNNSQYVKFWESKDAQNLLRIFLQDPDIIKRKQAFWRSNFSVDPALTPRDESGVALFRASARKRSIDNMLDWRAPLADTEPRDKKGLEFYAGSIPDFAAKGYVENAMEREAKQRMFEAYFGNDAEIVAQYALDIQEMFDEAEHTVSNLGAQLISKAYMNYNYGTGIQGNIGAVPIFPENHKINAGEKAWADPACKLLDQMSKIEQDYRDETGSDIALKWQLDRDTYYNVFLKNAQVLEYVASFRTINDKPTVSGWAVTREMVEEAFRNNEKISPVEVVEEQQRDGSKGTVHGWEDGVAVLRPRGFAGQIKRASILDEAMAKKYGSSVIKEVYSGLDIYTVVNTTLNNGRYKEWHTDLLFTGLPTLDEFFDHIIVDTLTADSGSGSGSGH